MARQTAIGMHVLFAGLLWVLISCAGPQPMKTEPIPVKENPAADVNSLDSDLRGARKNQLNVLVPESFAKAEKYLNNAKRGLESGSETSVIYDNISRGRAELTAAEKKVKIVRTLLSDAIEARTLARVAGATQFENDYAKIEEDFLDLTRSIERDNLDRAKRNQSSVSERFRELELRAIKEKTLGEVRESLRIAKKGGAKKIAPETFALAQRTLVDVDTFISEQRYQTEVIHKKANEALFLTQRLNQIMRLSEKMRSMKPEEISLFFEDILLQITKKLSATDMRNEELDLQIENILGSISALQNDRQFMVEKAKIQQTQIEEMTEKYLSEIANLTRQIAALEGRTREERAAKERLEAEKRAVEERLAAERQFNYLYNEVQNYFKPNEAEVYKKGYQLVIRLKDMKFPVGKAIIRPDNYQLLSKVQRAIRTFGEPDVVIEGHTDSTGSAADNEHLSQQRAEAVREYLVANRTLIAEKILAVGYGFERPLASNETPEGRAINRRIDVIIKPMIKEEAAIGPS